MYDMKQRRRITHVPRTGNSKLRPELYPAHLAWKNEQTLLIGWANEIKVRYHVICRLATTFPKL